MNDSMYLIALQAAADAGDSESQFRLARYHINKCAFNRKRDGAVRVAGIDHWRSAQRQLTMAIQAGHPQARMLMGSDLFKGHPVLGHRPLWGSILWLSGWLKQNTRKSSDIKTRLLARAKVNPSVDESIKPIYNIPFLAGIGSNTRMACRIRVSMEQPDDCHIVIEQSDRSPGPSITNSAEQIATIALYKLWLDGIDISPEKIHWYEAYPAHEDGMHPEGSLVGIEFQWNGEVYHRPRWLGRPTRPIPVDLKDILIAEGN